MTTEILEGLQKALDLAGGTHTLADVARQIAEGSAQLWLDDDACIVSEVIDTPQKRMLRFWLAAGKLDPVVALSRKVLAWGKEQGCTMATLTGRRGWDRVLLDEGWSPALTVMTRGI
jgi:hypothetical protein